MINNFHFLRPIWLGLLPLFAVLLWLYHHRKAHSRSWRAACDPQLLPHLLMGNAEGRKSATPLFLVGLGGSLALFALAGPVWKQLEQPVFRDQSALVTVLDLSRSMDATDIAPSRLTRARHKLIDILKKREEGQTALVVYAADAFVVSPLTQDAETIISQVSALKTPMMPRQGSRPDIALEKAGQLLKQASAPRGRILIITDGLEDILKQKMEAVVEHFQEQKYAISVLGVGSAEGAPIKLPGGGFLKDRQGRIIIPKLDETALRRLAQEGGGGYQPLSVDDSDIDALMVASVPKRLEDQVEETGLKTDRWREEGPWLLLALLPFAALAFRRGILAVIFLICVSLPSPAQAFDWEELWSRRDQRAAAAFSQGNEEAAAGLFENPEWKAASHYRAGQYQKSIDALEGIQTPDALYNKGNALAQMGRLPEAIQAYDEALKLDPKHEDASYNREELRKQMDQQEENQNNQQEGESSQDKEGEESEQSGQDSNQDPSQDQDGEKSDTSSDQVQKDKTGDEDNAQEAENKGDSKENQAENQDAQQAEKQDRDESDSEEGSRVAQADLTEQDESQQANEQWLRRIPDDPGGLLRRKFLYQSKQRKTANDEEHAW